MLLVNYAALLMLIASTESKCKHSKPQFSSEASFCFVIVSFVFALLNDIITISNCQQYILIISFKTIQLIQLYWYGKLHGYVKMNIPIQIHHSICTILLYFGIYLLLI